MNKTLWCLHSEAFNLMKVKSDSSVAMQIDGYIPTSTEFMIGSSYAMLSKPEYLGK